MEAQGIPSAIFSIEMKAAGEIKNALKDLSGASDIHTAEMLSKSIARYAAKLEADNKNKRTVQLLSADLVALVRSEKELGRIGTKTGRLTESFFQSLEILHEQIMKQLEAFD